MKREPSFLGLIWKEFSTRRRSLFLDSLSRLLSLSDPSSMARTKKQLKHAGRLHLPLPTGAYTVGCVDVMTKHDTTGCFMRLFYPTSQTGILEHHAQWPRWIPKGKYLKGYSLYLGLWSPTLEFLNRVRGTFYIPAIWDSPPLKTQEKFPVIVFSHGLGACRTTYSTICLELASQGYIVAAVEHRDESACASFVIRSDTLCEKSAFFEKLAKENGKDITVSESSEEESPIPENPQTILEEGGKKVQAPLAKRESMAEENSEWNSNFINKESLSSQADKEWIMFKSIPQKNQASHRRRQLEIRVKECICALDILNSLNKGEQVNNVLLPNFKANLFKDTMDMSKAIISGHSFGGATTLLGLANEPRFKMGLALDPWMVPFWHDHECLTSIQQPLLCVNMEAFWDNKMLNVFKNIKESDNLKQLVTIKGTVHLNQADLPFTCPDPISRKLMCGNYHTNHFKAMDLNTRLMLTFLDKHLGNGVDSQMQEFLEVNGTKLLDPFTKQISKL